MKTISFIFILLLSQINTLYDLCHLKQLQNYGLKGTIFPQRYHDVLPKLPNNYCPAMKYTCCTIEDFIQAGEQWESSANRIKIYVTQIYKSIQKINSMQSSLLMISNQLTDEEK